MYHSGPRRADPPRVGSPRGYSPIRRRFGATGTCPKQRRFAIVTKPKNFPKNNSFSFLFFAKQQRNPMLGFSYPNTHSCLRLKLPPSARRPIRAQRTWASSARLRR
ncbi:hypothetical protein V6Z12_D04G130200 [Gossypium hirsutum]